MDLNSNATAGQHSQLTPSMQEVLEKKLRKLNSMSIHEIYQLPEVRNNDFRLYKEAIGLISPEQVRREQDEIRERNERWELHQQQQPQMQDVGGNPGGGGPGKRAPVRELQPPRIQGYGGPQNVGAGGMPLPGDSILDQAPSQPPYMMDYRAQPQPVKAHVVQQVKSTNPVKSLHSQMNDHMAFGGATQKGASAMFNSDQIQFQKLILRVKYETSFGQDLWLLGSPDFLSSWDPNKNGGRGGMQMKWTAGHLWVAEIPYSKVQQLGPDQKFEFKFMVKFNNQQDKTYNIIRWEGGTKNHAFNGGHINKLLAEDSTKKFLKKQLSDQYSETQIKIGSYADTKRLHLAGSSEGEHLPEKVDKCVLGFDQSSQALIFHQFWQA